MTLKILILETASKQKPAKVLLLQGDVNFGAARCDRKSRPGKLGLRAISCSNLLGFRSLLVQVRAAN